MQLSCPNCAAKYGTEDYPNVFEIHCVCGYSILVPQESAWEDSLDKESMEAPLFDSAVPTAMDAEDDGLLIRPEGLVALNPDQREVGGFGGGVLDMTPPEELPVGLVYDSFELPPNHQKNPERVGSEANDFDFDLGNQDVFADSGQTNASAVKSSAPGTPIEGAQSSTEKIVLKQKETTQSKTQNLVTRSQLASMGNFLGSSFDLHIQDLSDPDLARVVIRVQKILSERPWLESEMKKRKINLENLKSTHKLRSVPEILALEIYLAAFEFGGQCHFSQSL